MATFKKFYIVLFTFILLITTPCLAAEKEKKSYPYKEFEPFKMVFLPDVNLSFDFEEKDNVILHQESLVILQDVIKNLNQEHKPDFVVFGGDLTYNKDGKFTDMPLFLDTVSELTVKYYTVLGEKEANYADEYSKEDFIKEFDEFNYETLKQTFWTVEPVENVLLIGLDTSVKGQKSGYLNIHQLFWLDNVLKNNRDKFTIIAMHHPPLITTGKDKTEWKKYTLEKPGLFLELINLYPQVKIVLSGHHYSNYAEKINEKLFITCPSITVYPNIYKVMEIYNNRIEIDNEKISFKQIIKKAKNQMIKSDYATEFNPEKPKSVIKYQRGNGFSRKDEYYFGEDKSRFFFWF